MISKETPIGSRVRVYEKPGDESSAWTGKTASTVDNYTSVRADDGHILIGGRVFRVKTDSIEPIGAKPAINHKFTCPNCHHEFER